MTILVTGATGNVGGHLVRALAERHENVRVFDRHAAGSLRQALDGADRLFLACGNVPEQVDFECAAIDAAVAAGVRRVVKLSGPSASAGSPLIFERWHATIEAHLAASALPHVLLRPRTFMTNLLAYATSVARIGRLFTPAGQARISFIHPRDVALVAAEALTGPGHDGRTYTLTGPEAITFDRVAAELSAVTGREVSYVAVGDEDAGHAMIADGLPPMLADAIVAIFGAQRAGVMAGTTGTVREVTGGEPLGIADFAREYAAAFRPIAAGSPG
ncbi:NmrA family NAD(P)-binding protein [Actinoplanes sp. GCM10030250]|uniref:NmrA family NAD(P)-binding protein n=1 Tax=Actinoplanes sp. GCM10030250 TaxID=3273376 RepID=UPI00360EA84F